MTTVIQTATSDAYVIQNAPTYKNPQANYLTVTGAGAGIQRYAFVYFNRPFPLGVTVLSATLRLFQKGAATGGSRQLQVRRVASQWAESTIDYDNQPGPTGAVTTGDAQGDGGADGRVWELDVTAHMQEVADGAAWYGFRIASTVATLMYLFSSESVQYQPQLEIEFTEAPEAPSTLTPSNGRSVSLARPTLRFDFTDNAGDTSMQGYELQISTTNSFPSDVSPTPIAAAADVPQHLMTTDILVGTVYYWRVRVQDGAGLWSEWSDVVSFTRTAKPSVVIDSPTDSVTESSPPVLWTVTGGTQTAYQLFVTDPDNLADVLWTSGKISAADASSTLPVRKPPLLTPGGVYGLVLRVWDGVEREATPGDPVYTDQTTVFTFDLSAGTTPVTTIEATTYPGRPDVDITVTRTAPDEFILMRDGVAQDTVPAADVSVGGGAFAWHDVGASPRTPHEWQMIPVVNGVAASTNPTATATTEPVGHWLLTLDGVHRIFVSGEQVVDFESSELSAVRKPLGATNPVLRTQAVYGPEGSIDGYAKARRGEDYADVVATWAAMTDPTQYAPGTPLVLTGVDTSYTVVLYERVRGDKSEFVDKFPIRSRFFVVR